MDTIYYMGEPLHMKELTKLIKATERKLLDKNEYTDETAKLYQYNWNVAIRAFSKALIKN